MPEDGKNGAGPGPQDHENGSAVEPERPERADLKGEVVLGGIAVDVSFKGGPEADESAAAGPDEIGTVGQPVSVSVEIPTEVGGEDEGGSETGERVGEPVGLPVDIPVEVEEEGPIEPVTAEPQEAPTAEGDVPAPVEEPEARAAEPPALPEEVPEAQPPEPPDLAGADGAGAQVGEVGPEEAEPDDQAEPETPIEELSVDEVASAVVSARRGPPPMPSGAPPPPPPPLRRPGAVPAADGGPLEPAPVRQRTDVTEEALRSVGERRWGDQVAELKSEMEGETRKPALALLHHEIGEIQETRHKDESAAIKSYGVALKLHASLMANLWSIRRMLYQRGKWPNLLKLIDGEIKLATSAEHRSDLLLERGDLFETKLGDLEGARSSYQEAQEAAPDRIEPLLRLEKLLVLQGDLEELARVSRRHAEVVETPERKSAILMGVARLMGQMGAGYEDRKAILDQALELGCNTESVLWDLERLALKEGRNEDFLEVLKRQAEALEAQDRPGQALMVRRRQARTAERLLGDAERAWEILQKQSEVTPDHPLLLSEMTALAWTTGRWQTLVDLLERRLAGSGTLAECDRQDAQLQLMLAVSMAGDPERAEKLLTELSAPEGSGHPDLWLFRERRVLAEDDPQKLGAVLEELGRLVAGEGWPQPPSETLSFRARLTALRAHLLVTAADRSSQASASDAADEAQVRSTDEDRAAESGEASRSADAAEKMHPLLEQAEGLCRHALEMDPGAASAAYLLEEVLARMGRWEELASYQRERLESADGSETARLLESLVDLYGLRLGKPEEELRALARLSELRPDDVSTSMRLAAELENRENWEEASGVYERLADRSMDPLRQADFLARAAELDWYGRTDGQSAAARLRSALEQAPEHPLAALLLEEVLTRSERWEDLASLLREQVERTLDESRLERLFCKLGEVLELRLGRSEEAAAVYEELLERFPTSGSALRVLARVWRSAGRTDRLADVLERQAEQFEDSVVRSDLLFDVAQLYEHGARDAQKAEDACLRAFALNPLKRSSLDALTRFYQDRREWQKVAEVLEEHLRALPDSALESTPDADEDYELEIGGNVEGQSPSRVSVRRARIVEDLAWIYESALQDPATGSNYWGELASGTGPRARRALWAALRQAVRDKDAEAMARQEVALASGLESDAQRGILLRAAVHRALAGEDAQSLWQQLAEGEGKKDAAFQAACLLSKLEPETAASLLTTRSESVDDPDDRIFGYGAAAALLEGLGQAPRIAALLNRVLKTRPDSILAVEGLRRMAAAAGDKDAEAVLSVRAGELYADPERSCAAMAQGARLLEELGNEEKAADAWRQVLARRPEDDEAFLRLSELLRRRSDWSSLNRLYAHRLSVCDEDEVVRLRVQRAVLFEEKLDDVRGAACELHRALKIQPDEAEASYRLGMLYAREGDGDAAVEWLKSCVVDATDPKLRQNAQFALAEVLEVRFGDTEGAFTALEDALSDAAEDDPEPLERMLSFQVRRRRWDEALETLDRLRDLSTDNKGRASLEVRKAMVYRDGLAHDDKAKSCLETARTLDPLNLEPVRKLAGIYRDMNDTESVRRLVESASQAQVEAIRAEPLSSRGYANLAALQEMGDEPERRFFALACLRTVSTLSEEQKDWYEAQRGFRAKESGATLSDENWRDRLVHPVARQPAWDLWQVVANAAAKIHADDLSRYGVAKTDKVSPAKGPEVYKEVDRLAAVMGVQLSGIYRWENGENDIKAVAAPDGPAMLVGARLEEQPMKLADRYTLGWQMGAVRAGAVPLIGRSEKDADLILAAAAAEGVPEFKHRHPPSQVESLGKGLRKAMSRKERKAAPVAAVAFTRMPFDAEQWLGGLYRSFERVGLLVCGDLETAVAELLEQDVKAFRRLSPKDRVEFLEGRGDVEEVVLFAVSEAFTALRKALQWAREP